jgi:UDP-2,3-diacylglucosamine pyrophosphatase LpxH
VKVTITTERPTAPDQVFWRFLASDLHLGSPHVDLKRLKTDLDAAAARNAKILLNGDVFDAIDHRDKRSSPAAVVPELRGRVDLINATVDYAFGILKPYAHLIAIVGIGNHEFKWIKWNSADPARLLVERLNAHLAAEGHENRVRHGSNNGFWRTRFEEPSGGNVQHDLYYFHGSGGDSPVTKGSIDVNRKETQFYFDAVTFGHKHNKMFIDGVGIYLSAKGIPRTRERKAIQTGSYYSNYSCSDDPLSISYAEEFHAAPKPKGGVFLGLIPERGRGKGNGSSFRHVRQVVMSDPLPVGA